MAVNVFTLNFSKYLKMIKIADEQIILNAKNIIEFGFGIAVKGYQQLAECELVLDLVEVL